VAIALFATWAIVAITIIVAWPSLNTRKGARIAALTGALVLCLIHQLVFSTLAEDAFISFRYALNLTEGHGLVFNQGEHVEGYSNFLWIILIAVPHALTNVDIIGTARALGILATLGCVVAAYTLTTRITAHPRAGILAAVLTAAASSLAAYGPSGLETPLFALLVLVAAITLQAGRPALTGVLVALATMTRPDGALIAAVLAVWLLTTAPRAIPRYLAGAAALLLPWTAWRLAYYGYLLPNAVAAKSGADLGWQLSVGAQYFLGFAVAAISLLVLVPPAIIILARSDAPAILWLLFALAGMQILFFVATGGDWMPAWRFFAPAMPLLAVGVAGASAFVRPGRWIPALAAAAIVPLLAMSVWNPKMKPVIDQWRQQVHDLAAIGAWLHRTMPPGTVVSTFANGALSYQAGTGLTVIDQLGLTDEHIARHGERHAEGTVGHLAYDYGYVVHTRKPAIVFVTGSGFDKRPTCAVLPVLRKYYAGVSFSDRATGGWTVAYLRKDRAHALARELAADPLFQRHPCPRASHPAD
jgi:arabinofuranosyltransferase